MIAATYNTEYIMMSAVAAWPPAAVDLDNSLPASMISAGWPILTYAPMYQRHREHPSDETIVGTRRPHMSMRKM